MGCGQTLVLAASSPQLGSLRTIACSWPDCPDSEAVNKILGDRETEHILVLGRGVGQPFQLQHPLRERIDGELFDCELHRWLRENAAPVEEPGRYRVSVHHPDGYSESYRPGEGGWDWERLPD